MASLVALASLYFGACCQPDHGRRLGVIGLLVDLETMRRRLPLKSDWFGCELTRVNLGWLILMSAW